MPVHHAIWRVGENPQPLTISKLASEQLLEKMILNDPTILSDQWMIIGHQEIRLTKGVSIWWLCPSKFVAIEACWVVWGRVDFFGGFTEVGFCSYGVMPVLIHVVSPAGIERIKILMI